MVRMTEDEYKKLTSRNVKVKVRAAKPTLHEPITQQKHDVCVTCGGALPPGRVKYCCDRCQVGAGRVRGRYGKVRKPKGLKLNRCRYCGRLANSADMLVVFEDDRQVKWFRCVCHPEESQLYHTVDMDGGYSKDEVAR